MFDVLSFFLTPGTEKEIISSGCQTQRKMQFLKNFLKKKTISIIAGKCFLAPRLTLGSFLARGLPPSSKKKPRVSLCARKLIFLSVIAIAIISSHQFSLSVCVILLVSSNNACGYCIEWSLQCN